MKTRILGGYVISIMFIGCASSAPQANDPPGASPASAAPAPASSAAAATATAATSPPRVASPKASSSASPTTDREPHHVDAKVGGVALDMSAADVTKLLGKAQKATPPIKEEATGGYESRWDYPAKGLVLYMEGDKEPGPFHVRFAAAEGAQAPKTDKGIGMGAALDDIRRAYGSDVNDSLSLDGSIIIGSEEGQLRFVLDDDTKKVKSIMIGRDAE